ncbi:MAG: DNA repair protein RecN [Gammaproteobacteria bacterium]|nr:DNA repair protein RecN [Gammaproteobacteria bacterium]
MLTHINIRNFAIVDHLELELSNQLSVLTGETGAGKSILIDALGLILGDRADAGFIRHDADKAEITASFDVINNKQAKRWLHENELLDAGVQSDSAPDLQTDLQGKGLDSDHDCIIRRTIAKDGRSRAYINGQVAPIISLRKLGELLVDIHGQHEHQSLMRPSEQRQSLDNFAAHQNILKELAAIYKDWKNLNQELQTLTAAKQNREERLSLLSYQVKEFDALALEKGEIDGLDVELKRLSNASRLVDTTDKILHIIYEDETNAVYDKLTKANLDLDQLSQLDNKLSPVFDLLTQSCIQLNEAASELREYRDSLEIDPQRLQWVDQRLATIHDLSRKHHVTANELIALHEQLKHELKDLQNADLRLEEISSNVAALKAVYEKLANKLTKKRLKAADTLAKQISENMQTLGMEGGRFEILVEPLDEEKYNATGKDRIIFQVTANPGQPLKPLTKVASGGELSRISLAIQVITAKYSNIPTLIFDEVDSGVGGAVAEMVGHLLRKLGNDRQIICVTHLPQVASLAHHHFSVNKQTDKNVTKTEISKLLEKERISEIARMLGGIEMTKQTLSHAKDMINRANQH